LNQQQLRLRQVYLCEGDVQAGPELILLKPCDLISHSLALFDGLLGHCEFGPSLENGVVSRVDLQQKLLAGNYHIFLLRLCVKT
jgi:hypothetical protein